jgi:hypothetical protein
LSTTLHPGINRIQIFAAPGSVRLKVRAGSVTAPSITVPNHHPDFTLRQENGTVVLQAKDVDTADQPWRTVTWGHHVAPAATPSRLQRVLLWLQGAQASYITRSSAMMRITTDQAHRQPVAMQPTITVLLPATSGQPQIARSHGGTS